MPFWSTFIPVNACVCLGFFTCKVFLCYSKLCIDVAIGHSRLQRTKRPRLLPSLSLTPTQSLNLSYNTFSGPLPDDIARLAFTAARQGRWTLILP